MDAIFQQLGLEESIRKRFSEEKVNSTAVPELSINKNWIMFHSGVHCILYS